MSHIATLKIRITNLQALKDAVAMLGGALVEYQATYTWYGRSVGDYPLPAGMKAEELGKNATHVIRLNHENAAKAEQKYRGKPYEIGVVADPNDPGNWLLVYDFFMRGYGLGDHFGDPVTDAAGDQILCPKLVQHYHMCCDRQAAQAAGDRAEFLTAAEARLKYPAQCGGLDMADDEYVMVSNTAGRVGA